jgi:hypothetical protein
MEKQNVTLSIPKDVLRKAKIIAIERDKSLSGLMTELLSDLVNDQAAYQEAKERQRIWMERGFNLGTKGQITWTREELYDR